LTWGFVVLRRPRGHCEVYRRGLPGRGPGPGRVLLGTGRRYDITVPSRRGWVRHRRHGRISASWSAVDNRSAAGDRRTSRVGGSGLVVNSPRGCVLATIEAALEAPAMDRPDADFVIERVVTVRRAQARRPTHSWSIRAHHHRQRVCRGRLADPLGISRYMLPSRRRVCRRAA
jgi:hypothetical protein